LWRIYPGSTEIPEKAKKDDERGSGSSVMKELAVLSSGGLDSCILLADLASKAIVHPVYVKTGLVWEDEEIRALNSYINALSNPWVKPVSILHASAAPLYGTHWSLSGLNVPGAHTPDTAVFLPGRNIILISLAAIWCSTHNLNVIAIGTLGNNPFPDATPEFFHQFGLILSTALSHQVEVIVPYRGLHKKDIISLHKDLPLEHSMTCMTPRDGIHCGMCNKCHERQTAFSLSYVIDRTRYAIRS